MEQVEKAIYPDHKGTVLPNDGAWTRNGQLSSRLVRQIRWVGQVCLLALIVGGIGLSIRGVSYAGADRPVQIGVLTDSWGPTPHYFGLRDGLIELGYRENIDFYLGVGPTEGNRHILIRAAEDLIELGANILYADSIAVAKAAQQVTTEIPIVFTSVEDPVGSGLIQNYARPGGNITGVASLDIELGPKRLEIFKDLVPTLKRVLFLYDITDLYSEEAVKLIRPHAPRMGIELVERAVHTKKEALTVLSQLQDQKIDGIIAPRCCSLDITGSILRATAKAPIPTIFTTAAYWIEHGGLASYGPNIYSSGRQAARIVDKIIRGANPAKIPVEVNSKIEFAINLQTAKALNLTVAREVIHLADHIAP